MTSRVRHLLCMIVLSGIVAGLPGGRPEAQEKSDFVEDMNGNWLLSDQDVIDVLSSRSLMMTDDVVAQLESARRSFLLSQADRNALAGLQEDAEFTSDLPVRDFALDAIMYLGPTSWTIWINGEAIKPTRMPDDLRIRRVTPQVVEVVWFAGTEEANDVRDFTLEPGQVYLAETGEVIESSEYASRNVVLEEITEEPLAESDAGGETEDSGADSGGDALVLSPEQIDQLRGLKDALASLPASALSDEQAAQLEQLSEALDQSDGESLSADQVRQLQDFQALFGGGQ